MIHIADAWKACDELTRAFAKRFPLATFTCVRDIYGRCSFAVEGLEPQQIKEIKAEVDLVDNIQPYLGIMGVAGLDEGSGLARTIREFRRPLGEPKNAFVLERLLSNESWVRGSDSNPESWPPVIAFYSFKGGVGRSTAAALTALTLAREGKRVVVIDLDLEAPGIEGYFFAPSDPNGKVQTGVVDYLLERGVAGASYRPEINDFVLPYSDPAVAATGGSLLIVPAGRVDDTYMERLGRLNLADIGRKPGAENPLRALIAGVLSWRPADLVVVDSRTGFTDLGGITLNGLSTLDVLVFRGGEADRRYLPVVLRHIRRFRESSEDTVEAAEKLARSFLIVYTMVELPPKADDAEQYLAELRRFTSEAVWTHVLERFANSGYAYPSNKTQDSPMEPVPHDVILIPYVKDFFMVGSVSDMLRLQAERPERPYDALVRRLTNVKLAPPEDRTRVSTQVVHPPASDRDRALAALERVTESAAGEQEFVTDDDFRHRFLPRMAYRTLLDPKAFLILGRKGTGKSALFKVLTHPKIAPALARHLGLDTRLIERTRWEIGFASSPGFPEFDDFQRVLSATGNDPDHLANFWRALAAFRLSLAFNSPIPGVSTLDDCIKKLGDEETQSSVRGWLEQLNSTLEREDRFCVVSHDDLDTGLTRDGKKRSLLVSALVEHWQQSTRRLPRIRAKIFLREDIWNREVEVTDKAKVRDGIDRGTITWDGSDIYRTLLKRLGHDEAFQHMLRGEGLWNSEFDQMLDQPLGFIPPDDEAWLKRCIYLLAGETMASGPSGYKKGYVYTWVLDHVSDSAGFLRPRNALLLFSEAAKLQRSPSDTGTLLNPRRFMEALRGSVSRLAVDDLRAEFKHEWSVDGQWLPDRFAAFEHVWPVYEKELLDFLKSDLGLGQKRAADAIEHMSDAGLLERREWRGRAPQIQIPDIYLFGLGLTRKG
jgi:hypothetical protein